MGVLRRWNRTRQIAAAIQHGLQVSGLPEHAVQVIDTPDRAAVGYLITMNEYVDVIVPRGGKSLIERISNEARIPVIKHLDGNCHVFVEAQADLQKALPIALNAKHTVMECVMPWKPSWLMRRLLKNSCPHC